MDKLILYIENYSSQTDLARALGVTVPAVYQWLRGLRPIPPRLAVEIERLTDGKVTANDICPFIDWDFIRYGTRK